MCACVYVCVCVLSPVWWVFSSRSDDSVRYSGVGVLHVSAGVINGEVLSAYCIHVIYKVLLAENKSLRMKDGLGRVFI